MLKKIKDLLLVVLVSLMLPIVAFAASDAVGNGEQGRGIGSSECKSTWMCQALDAAGVRFTFVDQTGKPVSGSYDFTTKTNGRYKGMVYNTGTGDKSKLTGGFTQGKANIEDLPKLSTLAGKMSWYMNTYDEYRSGKVTSINFSGDTGGNRYNMYKTETTWFNSMTLRGLDKETYTANVNAFMVALQDVYSDFNAEAMKMQMLEGCNTGQEIYIQMEPLFTTFYGGDNRIFVFGSIRDIVTYYEGRGLGAKARSYMNGKTNKFLWAIEYDRKIDASNFSGYEPATSSSGFTLESYESLNAKVGFAVALDWANSPDGYCDQCVYKDGNMYYEDKLISTYEPPFESLAEYALSKKSEGGMNCCNALETEIKEGRTLPKEWQDGYDRYCKTPGACKVATFDDETIYYCKDGNPCPDYMYEEQCNEDECCTLDPIEPGWIGGDVNNCCDDDTISEAHEYNLDDLFCDSNGLGLKNFKEKCEGDYYVQEGTNLDDKYCKMYCTERVSVEIPGAMTATSGRYFELSKTKKDTTSPYIEGFKRCRVVVQYQSWEEEYVNTVEQQISDYNKFQEDKANELMYDNALKNSSSKTENSNITCGCSCTYETKCADGKSGCKGTAYAKANDTCQISYKKYSFNKMYDINSVALDKTKRDGTKDIYNAVEIIHRATYKTSHEAWSAWNINDSIKACDQKVDNMEKQVSAEGKCQCVLSCSRTTVEGEKHVEDVKSNKDKYSEAAKNDNSAFNANADLALNMEKTIDRCTKYFTDYEGADTEKNYDFDVEKEFTYSQVYMDEKGKLALDEIKVDFSDDPGCVIDPKPIIGPDEEDKLSDKQYSESVYGKGAETMTDFKNSTLEYQKDKNGFKSYIDTPYEAEKVFTHDAKYHVVCWWKEGENNLYTLVPNGSASESTSEMNYTQHGQEYRIYLTALDGTYETKWNLRGLGSKLKNSDEGKFDEYFLTAGKTCANETPKESAMLSCKLHTEHEIVLTGYCNKGSNESDTTVDPDDCDPYEEGYRLFNFKVADAANLFPSGFSTPDGNIAANWTETKEGERAMEEIQKNGEQGKTFAPENLTYSFILSPTDMGHIKNYNAYQYGAGGYSDFTLNCSSKTCEEGACSECKSPFLENLSQGIVKYDNSNHSVTGWANRNKDLTAVRKSYNWN